MIMVKNCHQINSLIILLRERCGWNIIVISDSECSDRQIISVHICKNSIVQGRLITGWWFPTSDYRSYALNLWPISWWSNDDPIPFSSRQPVIANTVSPLTRMVSLRCFTRSPRIATYFPYCMSIRERVYNDMILWKTCGPVGIRTRVRGSGGPYAIQAILRAQFRIGVW